VQTLYDTQTALKNFQIQLRLMTNTWGLNASQMQLVQQASQPYINEDNVAHGQHEAKKGFQEVSLVALWW